MAKVFDEFRQAFPETGVVFDGLKKVSNGFAQIDPTVSAKIDDFKAPDYVPGQQFESTYDPAAVSYTPEAYTGEVDTGAAGGQFRNLEDTLGVQGFDQNTFRDTNLASIRANVNAATKARQASAGDQAVNQRVANSGMARARKDLLGAEGDRTFVNAAAGLEGDIAGLQQNEDARRTAGGLQLTGMGLQNDQFGAGLTDSQARFGAEFEDNQNRFADQAGLAEAQFNEGQRTTDNEFAYNDAVNEYGFNEVAPGQRADAKRGALFGTVVDVGTGLFQAVPSVLQQVGTKAAMAAAAA